MKKRTHPIQPRLRLRDRRRRVLWLKFLGVTAILLTLAGGTYYVARLPNFRITDVTVSGADMVSSEDVAALAKGKLAGSYAYVIPYSNAFFTPRGEIKTAVMNAFPPVADVKVAQKDPHTLTLALTERAPEAKWCASADDCYLMDKGGFIFAKADAEQNLVAYSGVVSGNPIGQTFPDFASLDGFIRRTAETITRGVTAVSIDGNGDVFMTLAGGGVVKFVETDATDATLENIASVFASQSFKNKPDFEYADFRYGNKVYVKFKGE